MTIDLARGRPDATEAAPAVRAKSTGLRASGSPTVKLALDGKEIGPLPQEVKDVSPGEHKVRLYATERYKPEERTVTLMEDEMKDLGAVKLDVVKGQATFTLDTLGATVTLVSGGDRRAIRQFPTTVELDPPTSVLVKRALWWLSPTRQPRAFTAIIRVGIGLPLKKLREVSTGPFHHAFDGFHPGQRIGVAHRGPCGALKRNADLPRQLKAHSGCV